MHAYMCKPLYKYQCVCGCACMCVSSISGLITWHREGIWPSGGPQRVRLQVLQWISSCLYRSSCSSHLKLMQMFITWQRRLWRFSSVSPGTGVSSLTLSSWLWIFNGAERLGWGAVVSGPVRTWALRFRRSSGQMWVSAAVERQKHREGWRRQIPAAETLPSRCAVRFVPARFRLPVRSLMIRLERMMMLMPRTV